MHGIFRLNLGLAGDEENTVLCTYLRDLGEYAHELHTHELFLFAARQWRSLTGRSVPVEFVRFLNEKNGDVFCFDDFVTNTFRPASHL